MPLGRFLIVMEMSQVVQKIQHTLLRVILRLFVIMNNQDVRDNDDESAHTSLDNKIYKV